MRTIDFPQTPPAYRKITGLITSNGCLYKWIDGELRVVHKGQPYEKWIMDTKITTDAESLKQTIEIYQKSAEQVEPMDKVLAWRIKRCAVEMEALLEYITSRTEAK